VWGQRPRLSREPLGTGKGEPPGHNSFRFHNPAWAGHGVSRAARTAAKNAGFSP